MNEWQALMFAVCENPDDDTPRLVLADWLEENGEPERAQFIRLQIQLARGTYPPNERKRLEKVEQKLITIHGRRWHLEVGGGGLLHPTVRAPGSSNTRTSAATISRISSAWKQLPCNS